MVAKLLIPGHAFSKGLVLPPELQGLGILEGEWWVGCLLCVCYNLNIAFLALKAFILTSALGQG